MLILIAIYNHKTLKVLLDGAGELSVFLFMEFIDLNQQYEATLL